MGVCACVCCPYPCERCVRCGWPVPNDGAEGSDGTEGEAMEGNVRDRMGRSTGSEVSEGLGLLSVGLSVCESV